MPGIFNDTNTIVNNGNTNDGATGLNNNSDNLIILVILLTTTPPAIMMWPP